MDMMAPLIRRAPYMVTQGATHLDSTIITAQCYTAHKKTFEWSCLCSALTCQ